MSTSLLIGSVFEAALRVLLLLDQIRPSPVDEEQISCIDFLAINSRDFNLLDRNLNGDGPFRLAEYSSKKRLISMAIKNMVIEGNVAYHSGPKGFTYSITDSGHSKAVLFNSEYSKEYRKAIVSLLVSYPTLDANKLKLEVYKIPLESLI